MPLIPLTLACMLTVTQQHNFPRETMFALLAQEAGTVGQSSRNANGTYDHGPYQVNDVNVPHIARAFGLTPDATRERLRDDGCFNATAAGYLLSKHLKASGDIWTAIGHYHSKTQVFAESYRGNVYAKALRLYEPITPNRNRKNEKRK